MASHLTPSTELSEKKSSHILAQIRALDFSYSELWRLRRALKVMEENALIRENEKEISENEKISRSSANEGDGKERGRHGRPGSSCSDRTVRG